MGDCSSASEVAIRDSPAAKATEATANTGIGDGRMHIKLAHSNRDGRSLEIAA
jgi:hypothetical protein